MDQETPRRRRARGAPAVVVLSAVLVALTGVLLARPDDVPLLGDGSLPWWVLVPVVALAEVVVVRLHVRGDTLSLSFTEVPLVVGALLLTPGELVPAVVLGSVLGLLRRRPPLLKASLNVALAALEAALATTLLHALLDPSPVGGPPAGLAPAVLVTTVAVVLAGALVVAVAIVATAGLPDARVVLDAAVTDVVAGLAKASAALLLVVLADWSPTLLLPLAALLAVLGAAHTRHARLVRDHERLEHLHRVSSRLQAPGASTEELSRALLAEVRDVLGVRRVEVAWQVPGAGGPGRPQGRLVLDDDGTRVAPPAPPGHWAAAAWAGREVARRGPGGGRSAVAVPLGHAGDGTGVGVLLVADRLRARGPLRQGDVRLLRLLAGQAGVALQRARLVDLLRREAELQERAAVTDALTGLPNRGGLLRVLDDALAEGPATVVVLDLDGFADVNEALGHDVGDEALRAVGRHLVAAAGDDAVVARLGDDEFALLLRGCPERSAEAAEGVEQLLRTLPPARAGGVVVDLAATAGLAAGVRGETAAEVFRRAETALAAAGGDRTGLRVWSTVDELATSRRLAVVQALRRAIAAGELQVAYQPVVEPGTLRLSGAEALVRWTDPVHDVVPPDEFVPLAERSGLVPALTSFVLRRALADLARWRTVLPGMTVSVNLSPRCLQDPDVVDVVADALAEAGVPPSSLVLEITETAELADLERSLLALGELRALGVRLSVDDFGTGHSSLAYLQVLPVGEVKIDRTFVGSMLVDRGSAAIVGAAVRLGQDLGLHVVAEGVEDEETLARLGALGVRAVQGYHTGRPAPAAEMDRRLGLGVPVPRRSLAAGAAPAPAVGPVVPAVLPVPPDPAPPVVRPGPELP